MSTYNRCAACKCLRRRCPEDCVFAPYFPSTRPERFAWVHKIYGASNVSKMLQHVPVHLRTQAANSLTLEAHLRVQDPIYGCVGIISQLEREIYMTQYELARTQAQLALYDTQRAQQAQAPLQLGLPRDMYISHPGLLIAHQPPNIFHDVQPLAQTGRTQVHGAEASSSSANQQDTLLRVDQLLLDFHQTPDFP